MIFLSSHNRIQIMKQVDILNTLCSFLSVSTRYWRQTLVVYFKVKDKRVFGWVSATFQFFIGAIFIYLTLSILAFYFVLLKKVAKIHFVSNFTQDGKSFLYWNVLKLHYTWFLALGNKDPARLIDFLLRNHRNGLWQRFFG